MFFYKIERFVLSHFDIAILIILLGLLAYFSFSVKNWRWDLKKETTGLDSIENFNGQLVKNSKNILIEKTTEAKAAIVDWSVYENKWYGFKLNYPTDWEKPVPEKPSTDSKWEYRYSFRKKASVSANDLFSGFNVVIYNIKKANGFSQTDEFPSYKNHTNRNTVGDCLRMDAHLYEDELFPAEEVHIPSGDDCFYPGFFYTLTKDNYVYNIIPVAQRSLSEEIDLKKEVMSEFPEFFDTVKTLNLIEIVRPKPVPIKPKNTAPKPVSYKVENGRLVCAKKHDKPGKSDKGKGKHLDMECCLDPDEYPNPWCYYNPAKYGKYLK